MAIALAEVSATGADLRSGAACVPFTLGPFTITPYLADHSAYDAFSLLIEAGGRSLFYTGDLRGHGRKATAFERLLADPPSPIHAILMEGTSFRNVSQCIGATATPSGAVVWSLWDGYLDQPSGRRHLVDRLREGRGHPAVRPAGEVAPIDDSGADLSRSVRLHRRRHHQPHDSVCGGGDARIERFYGE